MDRLSEVIQFIDQLSPDELETVYRHIAQRRNGSYWLIPGKALQSLKAVVQPIHTEANTLTDAEIDAIIDDALIEVRHERDSAINRRD